MANNDLPPTVILQPGNMVTGVRGWTGSQVVLTGTIVTEVDENDKVETAMIYCGDLVPSDPSAIFKLEPQFPEGPAVDSTFYGPDTWVFNPSLGEGNIRAVGTCTFEKGEARNHGMVYHGPPDGSAGGRWTLTDMPDEVAGGIVWNTVPHSTMGELIVGNYDLKGRAGSANAYVHDGTTSPWQCVALEGLELVTFYGVWQNGKDSTQYTICGGAKDSLGINQGLLVDYDSATRAFSNQRLYRNPDNAIVITHFEGVTLAENGAYHLAAMSDTAALLATVRRLADGSFGEAIWSAPFTFDGEITTGNTVYQDVLMGVFQESGSPIQSYAVTPGPIQGGSMAATLRSAVAARSGSH